jgi:hypothetical protein
LHFADPRFTALIRYSILASNKSLAGGETDKTLLTNRGVQRGVSKGVEDGCRLHTLLVGHPGIGRKAVSEVARL